MAKPVKAHINRQAPGDYEYLTTIAFDNDQSECLRISKIRIHKPGEPNAFEMPADMLTWYTEHAPAGREITRDDNNQKKEALLYVELPTLKEQIETFSLKDLFFIDIEIKELDRDDESLTRRDNGAITIEVQLYSGPRAGCDLSVKPLAEAPAITRTYPQDCRSQGRFDLAEVEIRAKEGPLDPRSDKRVIIANLSLNPPYEALRPAFLDDCVNGWLRDFFTALVKEWQFAVNLVHPTHQVGQLGL